MLFPYQFRSAIPHAVFPCVFCMLDAVEIGVDLTSPNSCRQLSPNVLRDFKPVAKLSSI
jgi:hypothetical protein